MKSYPMREIKFRGKTVYGNSWFQGLLTKDSLGLYYISRNGRYEQVISESIGQYTGLKDKNGNEIYEGDTLKVNGYNTPLSVVFRFGAFLLVNQFSECDLAAFSDCSEIIGNVYDTPELMKDGSTN